MIYSVTFNPAVDLVVDTAEIRHGELNRLSGEQIFFGGKGINVSVILHELGVQTKALGFIAGFTGAAIEQSLQGRSIPTGFIRLPAGFSRINVKIRSDGETELDGSGPDIGEKPLEMFFRQLDELSEDDWLDYGYYSGEGNLADGRMKRDKYMYYAVSLPSYFQ